MKKFFLFGFLFLFVPLLRAQSTYWQPVDPPGSTGFTATIIGVIEIDGFEQHSSQLEVGVFHGDVCRGTGLASTVALNRNLVFLSLFGINGEEDTFRVYDHATKTELDVSCEQTFVYHDNGQTGTIPAPYVFGFVSNHIVINVSANPTIGGTAMGGGTYDRDALVTLKAAANYGYVFGNWTKESAVVSTEAMHSFVATVETQGDYVANFNPIPYEITALANPIACGTVSGGGTHDFGTNVTLTATPATGYHFVNWTKDGTAVSTNVSYSFVVSGADTYVANFELNSYAINVSANPTVGGTVTGGGNYDHFATCEITAAPATGYHFVNWTLNGTEVSSSATYSFEVSGAAAYVANFELNSYEITATADPTAGGTVTGAAAYSHFETCTLTASANTGYTFINWTKDGVEVSTDLSISFMVEEAASYVAHFSLNSYEITVSADPIVGGAVTGAGTYNHFSTCTLTATPSTGYHFVNWTLNGTEVSTLSTYAFEVASGGAYVAHFALNSYEITATADPTAGGTITGMDTYNHFETCTLTASANTGYTFVNWTKDGMEVSTELSISFMVEGVASYVAHFNLNSYEITATVDPSVGGTVTGAGTYNHFETCTLVATPAIGYHFENWTLGGTEVSTSAVYEFEVSGAGDYVANFEINTYEVTATVNPTAGGTVTGAGTYEHFATCTLVAAPAIGYHFVNWTLGGVEVSTSATYEFEVSGAGDYVANFEINTYEIAVTVNPTVGGTVTGTGSYEHFSTCILVATPATGYHFVNWTQGGVEVSTSATYEFEVSGAGDYVANFAINTYEIGATANNALFGTVTGAGTYEHFATCTLVATPATGYHFVNWTLGGVEVSTSATYEFEVSGAGDYVANFEINTYEIAVIVNPTVGGTVTGAGTYEHFATCTLVATPATGYHFVNWTQGGVEYSTDQSISFEVSQAESFEANFAINTYEIGVTANNALFGTVTGAGTYEHFATCTLVATPATGYHFVNWTLGGVEVSTSATYEFEVSGAGDYVANFEINTYEIAVTVNPTVGGTVAGAGTYEHFATCALVATPATGYHFVNWTLGGIEVSTSATYEFEVSGSGDYVANFEINTYEIAVTVNPTVGGTVTGAGTYEHFATCTLVSTPATGYHFVNWTQGGVEYSTDQSISFEVSQAESFEANFTINTYEIGATANNALFGTVTGAGTYEHFATCTLTATPSTGYHFVNWTLGGMEVSTSATYEFEVNRAGDYVANFEINTYEIAVIVNPTVGGTVTGAGTYEHFATCTLVATPATGYHFVNWTQGGVEYSTDQSISFEVSQAESFEANFAINTYVIGAVANNALFGTVTGTGSYEHFSTCILVATPATGYHFVNWTQGGVEVSTSATYEFEVSGAGDYVANFAINTYEIGATANNALFGTVTGAGTYEHFATCTLVATPATGYHFVNWTLGGVEVSTSATYEFEVNGAGDYVANFEINTYEVTVTVNPTAGGTVTGAGTYEHFATCILVATPATGYHFLNWTQGGVEVSTSATYEFEVSGAGDYVANFEINSYEITVTANPAVGGTVTGGGTYNHFETCTITAVPDDIYLFVSWTLNGEVVSTNPTYSFTVTGNAEYVAVFELGYVNIQAYVVPNGWGVVEGTGEYLVGTTCTLTAIPNMGYVFVKWTNGNETVSTDATYSFVVTENATYRAYFEHIAYSITAEPNPEEGGSITGTGDLFYYNTTCQLVARANPGYHFESWTKDGTVVSTSYIYNFTVTESGHYVANFDLDTYEIVAIVDPEESGAVTGAGSYVYGQEVTLTAIPNPDFRFVNWTEGEVVVSEEVAFTFVAERDVTLVAHFVSTVGMNEYNAMTVTVYPNPVADQLYVETDRSISRYEVYTITGTLLFSKENCEENIVIDVHDMTSGTYVLRILSGTVIRELRFIKY